MDDAEARLNDLKAHVKAFCDDRDWDKFHNIKELALSMSVEASELLEHFTWKSAEESDALLKNPARKEEIEDELADIFYHLLRISEKYDLDLSGSLMRKLEKNEKKYPLDKSKGINRKYTEFS